MWFNIVTENHGPVNQLRPANLLIVEYIRHALGICGHEVTVGYDQLYPAAINLYLENFPAGRDYAAEFRKLRRGHSLVIGVVSTELVLGDTIPYMRDMNRDAGPKNDALVRPRIARFNDVAKEVDFVWSLLERSADEYRSRCSVSEFFPVGCSGLVPPSLTRSPKDIDVFFFGIGSDHRVDVLKRLMKNGLNVIVAGDATPTGYLPSVIVDSMLDRSRIALNLTLSSYSGAGEDPRFASCTRIANMLQRRACVVSEAIPLDNPYMPFMVSADIDDLTRVCRQLLDSGEWASRGPAAAEQFAAVMDVRKVCGPVIERTLARIRKPTAA